MGPGLHSPGSFVWALLPRLTCSAKVRCKWWFLRAFQVLGLCPRPRNSTWRVQWRGGSRWHQPPNQLEADPASTAWPSARVSPWARGKYWIPSRERKNCREGTSAPSRGLGGGQGGPRRPGGGGLVAGLVEKAWRSERPRGRRAGHLGRLGLLCPCSWRVCPRESVCSGKSRRYQRWTGYLSEFSNREL